MGIKLPDLYRKHKWELIEIKKVCGFSIPKHQCRHCKKVSVLEHWQLPKYGCKGAKDDED